MPKQKTERICKNCEIIFPYIPRRILCDRFEYINENIVMIVNEIMEKGGEQYRKGKGIGFRGCKTCGTQIEYIPRRVNCCSCYKSKQTG